MISSFIGAFAGLAAVLAGLVTVNHLTQVTTGEDIVTFITTSLPNIYNIVVGFFDLIRTFYSLLPGGIKSIFILFVSIMSPFLIYKFFKK